MQQFNTLANPETRPDEVEAARRFQFAIHHVGINCGDSETGLETARVLCALFGLTPRTLPGISTFADPFIECMHKKGRGGAAAEWSGLRRVRRHCRRRGPLSYFQLLRLGRLS